MAFLFKAIDWLVKLVMALVPPTDDDPAKLKRWRWFVATTTYGTWLLITLLVLIALGVIRSPWQLAIADETKEEIARVAEEAKAAASEVKSAVDELAEHVETFSEETKRYTTALLEQQMWSTMMDMCWRPAGQRAAYRAHIAQLQAQYVTATGGRFDLPDCEDL